MVLPILDYPPIPTLALSTTYQDLLQNVENTALRFATSHRYPSAFNTQQIHEIIKTTPLKTIQNRHENLGDTGTKR